MGTPFLISFSLLACFVDSQEQEVGYGLLSMKEDLIDEVLLTQKADGYLIIVLSGSG